MLGNIWKYLEEKYDKYLEIFWGKEYRPTPTSSSSSPSSKEFRAEPEPDGELDTDFLDNRLSL